MPFVTSPLASASCSLDLYLRGWCSERGVDRICTQLEVRGGVHTGRYSGADCSGRYFRWRERDPV